MSDFAAAWNLSRGRLVDEIKDLNDEQMRWHIQPNSLSIGQMSIHVAGVELSFGSQLTGMELDADLLKLKSAATEGVVNDNPFPYSEDEITAEFVLKCLGISKSVVEPLIENPTPEVLTKEIKSALGPIITGHGAFARFTFHPAYHQGQAYLMKTNPGFPTKSNV